MRRRVAVIRRSVLSAGRIDRAGQLAAEFAQRFHVMLGLAAVTGIVTGVLVAAFERAVDGVLTVVERQSLGWLVAIPILGLVGAAVIVASGRHRDSATTDAYVRAYHERGGRLRLGMLGRKLSASAVTLGTGNALGFEGPSMLIGATVGSEFEHRFATRWRRDDAKVLMVAGAAAGVAAVFKAPLTGVVFALEVPYRADLARRALLPCLVAAGTSYVTYVAIVGTDPLLDTGRAAPFDLSDLGAGLVLGVLCGALARVGAWAIAHAKRLSVSHRVRVPVILGGALVLAPLAEWWFDGPVHLGPGYLAIDWAASAERSVILLAALFAVRAVATWVSVGAGGVGGLFIPLVTQGAILGSIVQRIIPASNEHLLPTVGIAAFLGAGYCTPLAGVAFVAEATGQPGFLVPALLAAAAAQLVMGGRSFSPYQAVERRASPAALRRLHLADVMSPSPDTVDSGASIEVVATRMFEASRRWIPVVDAAGYRGLLSLSDLAKVPQTEWPSTVAGDVVAADTVTARADDSVWSVAAGLRGHGQLAVAVVADGRVVGVVSLRDLENVETLIDHVNPVGTDP